jgi:tetratricopeptide (TPR) repeat protein
MKQNARTSRPVKAPALLLALAAVFAGCGRGRQPNAASATPQPSATQTGTAANASAAPADVSKLDAEIERLEHLAERNPADDDARDELARVYVRRGDAKRAAGQLQEALTDYQRALRQDPDNTDAQAAAAAINEQIGVQQQGENGEPAPPPITPNVAEEDEKPAGKPSPTSKKP